MSTEEARPLLQTALRPHPDTPCPALQAITVAVEGTASGLRLRYRAEGDLGQLRLPAPSDPVRADGLWEHTCFEAFLAQKDSPAYREFNVSPSGAWAAYHFENYRNGRADMPMEAPHIHILRRAGLLGLEVDLNVNLPGILRVGLCAVIETLDGRLSYWALKHAPGRPDFHNPEAFALEIA